MQCQNIAHKKSSLPGYMSTVQCREARNRYSQTITIIDNCDLYEIVKNEWCDDVDLWPNVTYIDVGMYLLFSSSPCTTEQLKNYKSLDCYTNFANGCVRQILVKQLGENRLLIVKVFN